MKEEIKIMVQSVEEYIREWCGGSSADEHILVDEIKNLQNRTWIFKCFEEWFNDYNPI